MVDNRNKLPVAVEVTSGGEASKRTGGAVTSLAGIGSGSLSLGTATRFRILANLRSSGPDTLALIGYSSPATVANAEYILFDKMEVRESVPPGATLYFALVDATTLTPVTGGANDYLVLTKYE